MIVEGFMLSLATGDVAVSAGRLGDLAVDAVTLDPGTLGLGDGDHVVKCDSAGTVSAQLATAALSDGDFVIGGFTEATGAATAVTYAGRGLVELASS